MASAFHDIIECASRNPKNASNMTQRQSRLFRNRARHDFAGLQIERPLTADIKPAIHEDTIRVRARRGSSVGVPDFSLFHFHLDSQFRRNGDNAPGAARREALHRGRQKQLAPSGSANATSLPRTPLLIRLPVWDVSQCAISKLYNDGTRESRILF